MRDGAPIYLSAHRETKSACMFTLTVLLLINVIFVQLFNSLELPIVVQRVKGFPVSAMRLAMVTYL